MLSTRTKIFVNGLAVPRSELHEPLRRNFSNVEAHTNAPSNAVNRIKRETPNAMLWKYGQIFIGSSRVVTGLFERGDVFKEEIKIAKGR